MSPYAEYVRIKDGIKVILSFVVAVPLTLLLTGLIAVLIVVKAIFSLVHAGYRRYLYPLARGAHMGARPSSTDTDKDDT